MVEYMGMHVDMGVTENCENPNSYGVICVRCNECGRFSEQKNTEEEKGMVEIKTSDWLTRDIPKEQLEREKREAIEEAEKELREKEISNIAKIISQYEDCGDCSNCKFHGCCSSELHATNIYNEGYRRQSDVASIIFWKIDGITELFAKGLIGELEMYDKLAELKKKYTEDQSDG